MCMDYNEKVHVWYEHSAWHISIKTWLCTWKNTHIPSFTKAINLCVLIPRSSIFRNVHRCAMFSEVTPLAPLRTAILLILKINVGRILIICISTTHCFWQKKNSQIGKNIRLNDKYTTRIKNKEVNLWYWLILIMVPNINKVESVRKYSNFSPQFMWLDYQFIFFTFLPILFSRMCYYYIIKHYTIQWEKNE